MGDLPRRHAQVLTRSFERIASMINRRAASREDKMFSEDVRGELKTLQAEVENVFMELQILRNDSVLKP